MINISVIIPTYNRCDTLKNAVQSVFDQSYQDLEIIVVDDGSTDTTCNYLSSLNNPRLRYIRFETNRGGCHARNEGIKQSKGTVIAFLDDDDCWMPQKLERQIKVINEEQVDLCYSAKYIVISGKGSKKYSFIQPRFTDFHESIMCDNFIGSTSSIVVKKSVLEDIGGFDPNLPALQDYDLYIRLIAKGYAIKGIDEPLITYQIVDEGRNISCNFAEFRRASEYLCIKYRDDEYIRLLKQGLRMITLKRIVKSRKFLLDIIKFYLKKLTNIIKKDKK